MNDFKEGDLVLIKDGSQARRVDKYETYEDTEIGGCKDMFKVIEMIYPTYMINANTERKMHDMVIKNTTNHKIYIHSSSMVKHVLKVKEVTMDDVEKQYGCKVKIIK
jgi:hypothetical protein